MIEIIDHYNKIFQFSLFIKKIIPNFISKKQINKIILVSSLYSKFGRSDRMPYSISICFKRLR